MAEDKITFEQAFDGLTQSAEALNKPGTTLEDAIKSFETGIRYYQQCNEILKEAKQKIEYYSK